MTLATINSTETQESSIEKSYPSLFWPFLYALMTGVIISSIIDQIPLSDTNIPAYGYYSTVAFTEPSPETYTAYFWLMLLKGLIYLGAFWFFIRLLTE